MNQVSQDQGPSGLSIAALVTGLLSMMIVPIILGAIDLSKIKNGLSSPKGRGMDIAGIVLGAIGIVVWTIVIIVTVVLGSIALGNFAS
jgi:hypothetical protein